MDLLQSCKFGGAAFRKETPHPLTKLLLSNKSKNILLVFLIYNYVR